MNSRSLLLALLPVACTGVIADPEEAARPTTGLAPAASPDDDPGTMPPLPSFTPGPSGLRRLTNGQFQATMRSLLGSVRLPGLGPDLRTGALAQLGASHSTFGVDTVELLEAATLDGLREVFADPVRRDAFVGCKPASAATSDDRCAQDFLSRFARRAWRGTVPSSDLKEHIALARQVAVDEQDFYAGAQSAASAILQSPLFLYRVEIGEPLPGKPAWRRYTSGEMATRLSYFMTNTTPDDALLLAADANELLSPGGLLREATRLLDSSKFRDATVNFVDDLFNLGQLDYMAKDPTLYQQLTPTLRQAMRTELELLFKDVIFTQKGDVLQVLDTTRSFANSELGKLYGLSVAGDKPVPVTYPASTRRAGVLGSAAVLSLLSKQESTTPTLRGKFVRETLLCQKISAPPANDSDGKPVVTNLPPPPKGVSKRQQLEQHRIKPECVACHLMMDPLGYAMESFDALGIYRTTDRGLPLDTTGKLDGADFRDVRELGQRLREHPSAGPCLVRNLYRYATGRDGSAGEEPLLERLAQKFKSSGNLFRDVVLEIVLSDGFRFATAPGGQ